MEILTLGFFPEAWYSPESPGRFDFWIISRDIPREPHAPIKNNEKWREHTRVYGHSTVSFKWFHWKFCETGCSKDGKIIQHYLLDAIWQRTLGKLFIWVKNEISYSRRYVDKLSWTWTVIYFRYNISFIDPPLGWFGKILTLSDDISLGLGVGCGYYICMLQFVCY